MEKGILIIEDYYSKCIDSLVKDDKYLLLYDLNQIENISRPIDKLKYVFACYHKRINQLYSELNKRMHSGNYYVLSELRKEISSLYEEFNLFFRSLKDTEFSFKYEENYLFLILNYEKILDDKYYLPLDYPKIKIIEYDKIFFMINLEMRINSTDRIIKKKLIGSGSFAKVYKFKDPFLNCHFAQKVLDAKASDKDIIRFKNEFKLMNEFDSPYLLKAYSYDEINNSYIMELSDYSLKKYYEYKNNNISFIERKKIALQFLEGLKYIYSKRILHRDLSLNNILIKCYDNVDVVKISDFGLAKDEKELITSSDSSLKGTYLDPCLDKFGNYAFINEVYSIGFVLIFIFTGKTNINKVDDKYGPLVKKTITLTIKDRFKNIDEIVNFVKNI